MYNDHCVHVCVGHVERMMQAGQGLVGGNSLEVVMKDLGKA